MKTLNSPSRREQLLKTAGGLLVGLLLGAAIVSLPAFADWQDLNSNDFTVAAPPAPNSPGDKQDYAKLHEWEKTRTAEACQLGNEQDHANFKVVYQSRTDLLSKKERERAEPLMEKVDKVARGIVDPLKEKYGRRRPYDQDPSLKPCVDRKKRDSLAYPSGHATRGVLAACLLSSIYPDRKAALMEYGKYVGDLRVMIGVHHPTDVAAGQNLGQQICERMLADPKFEKELAKVR